MMITLFTTPKPMMGAVSITQRNAIQSWQKLGPSCEVILLGKENDTKQLAHEFGIHHIPDVEYNQFGTPLISSLFACAEQAGNGSILCYINADIILLNDFLSAIERIPFRRYLMGGRRWDVDINEPIDFSQADWAANLQEKVRVDAVLHGPTGIDYFVFPRGLWSKIPDFAVGRPAWDNWMIYQARKMGIAVIDATEAITVVHQNHDYSHKPGGLPAVWEGPEAEANRALAGGYQKMFTLLDANWLLLPDRIVRPQAPEYLERRKEAWLSLHPTMGALNTFFQNQLAALSRAKTIIWRRLRRLRQNQGRD